MGLLPPIAFDGRHFEVLGHHAGSRPALSGKLESPLKICPGLAVSGAVVASGMTRDATVGGGTARHAAAKGVTIRVPLPEVA